MKDKLRKSGCPENLSVEILGYSQGSVAANYGSGFAIEVMRKALVKLISNCCFVPHGGLSSKQPRTVIVGLRTKSSFNKKPRSWREARPLPNP
jgi:hypothetical protein